MIIYKWYRKSSINLHFISSPTYTAGKISIEHVTIFLSKYITKGAVDMKFSPGVNNNPSNPYILIKQISSEMKLCVIRWNDTENRLNYWNVLNTLFVGDDSFKTPSAGETRCDFGSFFHTNKSSNLEGFMSRFYELWSLVLIFYWIQGFKSGDCLAFLAALFSFSETSREFACL